MLPKSEPGDHRLEPAGANPRRENCAGLSGCADHSAWGLRIRSEIPVPFPPDASATKPEVTIRIGVVPVADGWQRPWESAPGDFRLEVDGVARYRSREGCEIVVEPLGDATGR